jgi:hypothetical protein
MNTPDLLSELSCWDLQTGGVNLVFVLRYGVRRSTKTKKKKKKTTRKRKDDLKASGNRHYWRTIIEQRVISRRRIVVKRGEMGSANKNGEAPPRSRVKPCKSEH